MFKGKVKSFDYATGSGFIEQENGGEDVKVHFSSVKSRNQRTLQAGQRVQFQINRDAAGSYATDVEILDASEMNAPVNIIETASPAPNRKKPRLWPIGLAGLTVIGALFLALSSGKKTQTPRSDVSPVSEARSFVAPKPEALQPQKKTTVAFSPIPVVPAAKFEGEKFSQTRLRLLSPAEVTDMTPQQVQYALNEIYARHGYRFAKSGPRKQFGRFVWYKPVTGQSDVASWQQFSEIERRNAQLFNRIRTTRKEAQARQTQIALNREAEQKRLDEQAQQNMIIERQVVQARQSEPKSNPTFSENRSFGNNSDLSSTTSSETPELGSSGDFTPTGLPIFTGPRGGRYHYSKSGRKVYEKR